MGNGKGILELPWLRNSIHGGRAELGGCFTAAFAQIDRHALRQRISSLYLRMIRIKFLSIEGTWILAYIMAAIGSAGEIATMS